MVTWPIGGSLIPPQCRDIQQHLYLVFRLRDPFPGWHNWEGIIHLLYTLTHSISCLSFSLTQTHIQEVIGRPLVDGDGDDDARKISFSLAPGEQCEGVEDAPALLPVLTFSLEERVEGPPHLPILLIPT